MVDVLTIAEAATTTTTMMHHKTRSSLAAQLNGTGQLHVEGDSDIAGSRDKQHGNSAGDDHQFQAARSQPPFNEHGARTISS